MAKKSKMFKWVIEIEVDETWVADGFNLTNERARSMIQDHISGCGAFMVYDNEVRAKVLQAPDARSIRVVQGYEDEPKSKKEN
jgi:hypothetical protein